MEKRGRHVMLPLERVSASLMTHAHADPCIDADSDSLRLAGSSGWTADWHMKAVTLNNGEERRWGLFLAEQNLQYNKCIQYIHIMSCTSKISSWTTSVLTLIITTKACLLLFSTTSQSKYFLYWFPTGEKKAIKDTNSEMSFEFSCTIKVFMLL